MKMKGLSLSAIIVFLTASCTVPHSSTYTITPTALIQSTTSSILSPDIQWLKANAIPFDTTEPNNSFEDLIPLKKIIGNAHIVALGEATHAHMSSFK